MRVRTAVGEALAFRTFQDTGSADNVIHANTVAVRVAEAKFVQVALQMLRTAKMIGALHAALERAEKVLDIIGGKAVLVDVLIAPMQQGLVIGKFLAELLVKAGLIGNENRLTRSVLHDEIANHGSASA